MHRMSYVIPKSKHTIILIVSGGSGIGYFSINASSCEVNLAQELDFETAEGYDLVIQAFDLDPISSRSTSMTFTIEVIDVNEFTPVSYFELMQIQGIALAAG